MGPPTRLRRSSLRVSAPQVPALNRRSTGPGVRDAESSDRGQLRGPSPVRTSARFPTAGQTVAQTT